MLKFFQFYKITRVCVTLLLFLSVPNQSQAIPLEETEEKSIKTGSQTPLPFDVVPLMICGNFKVKEALELRAVCREWERRIPLLITSLVLSNDRLKTDEWLTHFTNLKRLTLKDNTTITNKMLKELKGKGVTIKRLQTESPQECSVDLGILAMFFPW